MAKQMPAQCGRAHLDRYVWIEFQQRVFRPQNPMFAPITATTMVQLLLQIVSMMIADPVGQNGADQAASSCAYGTGRCDSGKPTAR
jgi:hypothetical protein